MGHTRPGPLRRCDNRRMPSFGLIGPSYTTQNRAADSERTVNLYPEFIESGNGASAATKLFLTHTPGFSSFCDTGEASIRAMWSGNNRLFVLAGSNLLEISSGGSVLTDFGAIGAYAGLTPGKIIAAPYGQSAALLVYDGDPSPDAANIYLATGAQSPFAVISGVDIAYIDGYFVALRQPGADFAGDPVPTATENGTQFNLSTPLNGAEWDPLQYGIKTASTDQLQTILGPGSFNGGPEELWLMGKKTIEVWYNTGGSSLNPFPFERVHGAFITCGVWAKDSVVGFRNTVAFLSGDDRGEATVVAMRGYTPERISNYAVENAIRGYIQAGSDVSDAIAYGYQENGHEFYVLSFPTAGAQWVYDLGLKMWHERASGSAWGSLTAPPAQFHATAFGKHFVGNMNSGVIYQASLSTYQETGSAILRGRISPHINNERLRMFYDRLQLDVGGPFSDTRTFSLENSNDGGFTYGTAKQLVIGPSQQSESRLIWRRLGMSRDRVFRVSTTDNLPQAWVDGYVFFEPSTGR